MAAFPSTIRRVAQATALLLPTPLLRLDRKVELFVGAETVEVPYRIYNPPLSDRAKAGPDCGREDCSAVSLLPAP